MNKFTIGDIFYITYTPNYCFKKHTCEITITNVYNKCGDVLNDVVDTLYEYKSNDLRLFSNGNIFERHLLEELNTTENDTRWVRKK